MGIRRRLLRILWSGKLVPRKALSLLIKAWRGCRPRWPANCGCWARAARTPLAAAGQRLARRTPHHLARMLPQQEALRHYAWADVFVFTSLRDTTGNVVLECGAGLPVVCLDHQGGRRDHRRLRRQDRGNAIPARWWKISPRLSSVWRRRRPSGNGWPRGAGAGPPIPVVAAGRAYGGRLRIGIVLPKEPRAPNGDRPTPAYRPPESRLVGKANRLKRHVGMWTAVATRELLRRRGADGFGILMYHRVARPVTGIQPPTWNVTPERFRRQMAGLFGGDTSPGRSARCWRTTGSGSRFRRGCSWSLSTTATNACTTRRGRSCGSWGSLPPCSCPPPIWTATTRYPSTIGRRPALLASMRRHGGHCGGPMRGMLASGVMEFGTHSHMHSDYRGQADKLRGDLAASLAVLRQQFGIKEPAFAVPCGVIDAGMVSVARQSGVSCCLTTESNLNAPCSDPFTWGRFIAENTDTAAMLAAKLDGWYSFFRRGWLRVGGKMCAAGVWPAPQCGLESLATRTTVTGPISEATTP